jgi:lysine-specific demethylase/histidyl-hydroxylase NO66
MHTLTRYLLVQELAALAANQAALRTALPLGFDPGDPEQLAEILPAVAELFAQEIRSATPDALAARLRRRTWSGNRPAPLPPLAHAAAIASLSIGTTVRLRPGLHCRVVPGDPVVLQLPDRTITFPTATQAAVTELTSGTDCKVGNLPNLTDADQLVLVRRLLIEAVLVATKN